MMAGAALVVVLFVAFYISEVTKDRPAYATGFDTHGRITGTYTPDAATENDKYQVGLGFILVPDALGLLGTLARIRNTPFWKEKDTAV